MPDKNEIHKPILGLIPITRPPSIESALIAQDQTASIAKFPESEARDLEQYAQEHIERTAPSMIPALIEGWERAIKAGDTRAMRDIAEAYKLLQPKGGISVNQFNNNSAVSGGSGGGKGSIEDIIRQMDDEKFRKRKESEAEIIDAEFTEPEKDQDGKR